MRVTEQAVSLLLGQTTRTVAKKRRALSRLGICENMIKFRGLMARFCPLHGSGLVATVSPTTITACSRSS